MLRLVLAFTLLLPTIAVAQQTATPQPKPASAVAAPASAGRPHICPHYPKAAVAQHAQGVVKLAFTVAIDGSVQDMAIAQSSGSDILDQAALECARAWIYKPATHDGQPVAVPWTAQVAWSMSRAPEIDQLPRGRVGNSLCSEHRRDPNNAATPSVARVRLTITADGSVTNATLAGTSGDTVFDAYAVTCVSGWRFEPPPASDTPATVTVGIAWTQ